ncbi:iron chelate uptake ABC transporter family permease subunit, partial [Klebsiella pneumoniae]|uniref:iron chelate uptake ABC transporter family permease subunit n=1 Tax=Klebsiella pneumoniae TaxID=573 RepID=UPI003F7AD2BC
ARHGALGTSTTAEADGAEVAELGVVAVAISGVIGFIGLVVPHLMRLWLGPDHRGLIPGSLLAGAILLLLADTLARTVAAPAESILPSEMRAPTC